MAINEKKESLFRQGLIPDWLDRIFYKSVTPLIGFCSSRGIDPNWLTFTGFLLNAFAAFLLVKGFLFSAGIFIGLAGILDFIDGKVAAALDKKTRFGAIFDSVLDRYSDILIYIALYLFYYHHGFIITAFISILALSGSVLTSYIKAIGQSHGINFRAGALRRQERITLIFAGLILIHLHRPLADAVYYISGIFGLHPGSVPVMPLTIAVYLLAILTNFTALQRFYTALALSRKIRAD